jgi:hypothetical protein
MSSHETRDVSVRGVVKAGIAIIASVIVSYMVTFALFGDFKKTFLRASAPRSNLSPTEKQIPPQPRLQITPQKDLKDYVSAQEQHLSAYGWIDRKNQIVHIPIEEAMKKYIEKGSHP